ncbi:hypothetical protein HH303_07480 [Rhodospirillaceae bacterium KN72]|uniref:Co-chaperone DjlA N-terminal domain-containing protein n=1 Tax=Pacificispira spongiicola TaxID=2729598 RepID=A0A7Y0DZ73_9PROT|nr:hypothetical protein [Pacificispira spongiicola]NMM44314.1 hypothetical protein [Pacificispira spongiicola]
MFLNELTDPQKKMFMALAKRMVLADWQLEEHEKTAIARVEAELGQSLDVDPQDLMSNDNLTVLDTDRARRIVYYELLVLAHADLKIDASERHVFDDLAVELKISQQIMNQLETLSADGYSLMLVNGRDDDHRAAVDAVLG